MEKSRSTSANKRRRRRRRRVRGQSNTVFALLFAVLFIVVVLVAITVFFKVSRINIVGQTRYSAAEIRDASGIKTGDNLFIINKFSCIQKISGAFVYLDTVKMDRILPDTIVITVAECIPEAAVSMKGKYWLIEKKGKLLEEAGQEAASKYPVVYGIEVEEAAPGTIIDPEKEQRIKPLFEILNSARTNGILNDIVSINMEKLSDLSLQYSDRFSVELGLSEELDRKIRFLKAVLEKLGASDRGVIDLTDTKEVRFRPDYAGG